jgi:hypothetical protein
VLSTVFSLWACADRPDVDLCIINAPNKNRKCFNLAKDYQDDGSLKPGAMPVYRATSTIEDLNKSLVLDSSTGPEDAIARMKAWVRKLQEECRPQ